MFMAIKSKRVFYPEKVIC